MSSAFKNFFITFVICLLVFGFIGGVYVYPLLKEVLDFSDMGPDTSENNTSSPQGDTSDDNSDTSDGPVVDGNYFDASGDVFTAVIVALDDNGNVSQCVFLDENAKTKQIIYCPINPNTIYFNEAGGLAEVKHLFAVMSPKEICQCVTAMTGIPVDYCFVMDKNSIKSIAALMDDCYSVMPGDVTEIIRYTVTEEEQTADLPAGEYEVKITNIGNQVKLNEELYGKTKLEWLLHRDGEENRQQTNYYGMICKDLLSQFLNNKKNKDMQTMLSVLDACKATNMTATDVANHLDTIFSFDSFQYNTYSYPISCHDVNDRNDIIADLRELDRSFGRS